MAPTLSHQILLLTTTLVIAVGGIDAAIEGEPDLLAIFVISLVLQMVVLSRMRGRRPTVPLRHDLVRWLDDRASVTGEPLELVADRAVARYRDEVDRGIEV